MPLIIGANGPPKTPDNAITAILPSIITTSVMFIAVNINKQPVSPLNNPSIKGVYLEDGI